MSNPTLRLNDGFNSTTPDLRDTVKELQAALNGKGYSLTIDGFFGASTKAAVESFQSSQGLTTDGVVGPATWAALNGAQVSGDQPSPEAPVDPAPTPEPSGGMTFTTTYAAGDRSLTAQLAEANKYREFIEASAAQYGFQPCVIAGVGSRESNWGLALKPHGPGGTGDFAKRKPKPPLRPGQLPPDGGGFGRGLMQIDFDSHQLAQTGNWQDPQANINEGCMILQQSLNYIKGKTDLEGEELLQAALAGYNAGAGSVSKAVAAGHDVDSVTANKNYSKDTLDRAGWFQMNGFA